MDERLLSWETIEVGEELTPLVKKPTTRTVVMWAGAVDAYAEIHYDKDVAVRSGYQGVILHGDMLGAYLMELLTNNIGSQGFIASISYRHARASYPNQTYTCHAKTARKFLDGSRSFVEFDAWIENETGQKTTIGKASVCIPRESG